MQHSIPCSKRRMRIISIKKKEKLIDLVMAKDKSIHSSAKKIGMKYSTAKAIVKRFKETGSLYCPNNQKQPLQEQEKQQELSSHEDSPSVRSQQQQIIKEEPVYERTLYNPIPQFSSFPQNWQHTYPFAFNYHPFHLGYWGF